jgi:glycosyltransferase involved in cell wall biosynthesis
MSDAPTLTTGFGRTTGQIMSALRAVGHDPICFGFKARPADVVDAPWRIWPAERGGHWTTTLPDFLTTERPDVLMLNMDGFNAVECLAAADAAGWDGPVVSYVVFDGLPVGRHYLAAQQRCTAVLASSHTGARHLRDNGVNVVAVAPPGVDTTEFRPLPDRSALRVRLGIDDAFVVGVFGTNTERKQIARVIAALPLVNERLDGRRVVLYMHCRPVGYWRLHDLAADLGVADQVAFPDRVAFDERRGVPTTGGRAVSAGGPTTDWPADLSYVDRINCCDAIVNVAHSGDIEQVILEAQACGVPLVHTDDRGVMAEAVGMAGLLLPARDVGFSATGGRMHHVAPEDVAEAIVHLARSQQLRDDMRAAGLANAARYTWAALESGVRTAVDHCVLNPTSTGR